MKMYRISYADGRTPVTGITTHDNAIATIRAEYPDAVCDHDGDLTDGGDRTLCWADEPPVNDDGRHAIASIYRDERGDES